MKHRAHRRYGGDEEWYLAGGISPDNVLGAWDFKNAPSYAISKISLINPSATNLWVDGAAHPAWAAGTGLTFAAASSQYLTIASAIATAVPITMICRFNADDVTTNYALMSICDTAAANYFLMGAYGAAAGDPIRVYATAAGASTGVGYTATTWYTAAGTYAIGETFRYAYLNGTNKALGNALVNVVGLDTTYIGVYHTGAGLASYLKGKIASCAFYNIELADAQVLAIHNAMTAL
jgi:hypothetical protein